MVFYNSIVTIVFLSIFALGALAMNDNIINWIDNHWDIIRNNVFSYDMEKFKQHVTNEINSLGIFSLTINATLVIKMFCITNLLSLKNIVIALSPLTKLMYVAFSTGLILIGFYSQHNSEYTNIDTWPSNVLITVGIISVFTGIMGYYAMKYNKRKLLFYHIVILGITLFFLILTCYGFFDTAARTKSIIDSDWVNIKHRLKQNGYEIRKSFLINQIQINLKFSAFFNLLIFLFLILSMCTSIYQYKALH